MSRHTAPHTDMTTAEGRAGLSARLAAKAPASALQDTVDRCVAEADALVARRRAAALARLPMGERLSQPDNGSRLRLVTVEGERISS